MCSYINKKFKMAMLGTYLVSVRTPISESLPYVTECWPLLVSPSLSPGLHGTPGWRADRN